MKTFLPRARLVLCGFGLFAASVCLAPAAARADEAAKLALINEMFEVTHVDTLMQQSMQQMEAAQKAQLARMDEFKSDPEMADKIWTKMYALIKDRLNWEKLKPDMVKLYADNFSEEELAATLNFYKSPAGQAVLKKLPVVMSGAIALTQRKMGDLMPDIQRIVREVEEAQPESETDKTQKH